ncbi:hypothetical protein LOTGIDRAFT_224221 [Lottia gigantea]|uniref:Large ribosomal subunit protein bL28m n=1 Tax=Lottia gigantea TaxID=225164 RepID=V4B7U2_LOTGI|nr:hypothetical protein LOTGIDRAFT_224221 [Lottia gigantea]ESP03691.1 hypothetical protein LOTGIDRAFT_224221 [Lottia gigantea]
MAYKVSKFRFVPYIYKWSNEVHHLLPAHYKRRCQQFMRAEPLFVHVKYNDEKYTVKQRGRDMIKERVQNVPVKVIYPEESNNGLWGGEGIIVGLKKCKIRKYSNRVPKIWKPLLVKKPLYSEIFNKFYLVTVTMRTLNLIDENFGFDNYILKTSEAQLNSQLAMKFKREMLLEICNMADNPVKHEKLLKRYDKFLMDREEAEWIGLPSSEAVKKAVKEYEDKQEVVPLKELFIQQLLEAGDLNVFEPAFVFKDPPHTISPLLFIS